ncbi:MULTISPECIES: hypothetical protein [unclassified Microbulbifer]|uniref:hypothetical protein n=1 Tax=unclassified Microbulbifer TaxID=2619833 RepID=UPI0027E3BF47|nr:MULTISPECIES: hypothetical protein [unclassified Microbulbifer]
MPAAFGSSIEYFLQRFGRARLLSQQFPTVGHGRGARGSICSSLNPFIGLPRFSRCRALLLAQNYRRAPSLARR